MQLPGCGLAQQTCQSGHSQGHLDVTSFSSNPGMFSDRTDDTNGADKQGPGAPVWVCSPRQRCPPLPVWFPLRLPSDRTPSPWSLSCSALPAAGRLGVSRGVGVDAAGATGPLPRLGLCGGFPCMRRRDCTVLEPRGLRSKHRGEAGDSSFFPLRSVQRPGALPARGFLGRDLILQGPQGEPPRRCREGGEGFPSLHREDGEPARTPLLPGSPPWAAADPL